MAGRGAGSFSAVLVGAASGSAAVAGGALLLHPGAGALASAGFLAATQLISLAAGFWVAGARPARPASPTHSSGRLQWLFTLFVYAVAGIFIRVAGAGAALPTDAPIRGLAVLLLMAAPAYATGWLVAVLHHRRQTLEIAGSLAAAVLAGAAAGALLAAAVFIPRADPELVFLGSGLMIAVAGTLDMRAGLPASDSRSNGMKGRRVLITGVGGRGQMGYALAEAFLAAGARVVVTGSKEEVERHAAELARLGEVHAVVANLTLEADVERVLAVVTERLGGLDALVNAAGGLSVYKPLADTTTGEWHRELDRNAATTFLVSRAALPLLRDGGGAIINFASPAGLRAGANLGAYSAAKAAVVALTRSLALEEVKHGVRVNAILPGLIDTETNRQSVPDPDSVRWVTREQIARVVLFLASDAADGISGETIHVAGAGLE